MATPTLEELERLAYAQGDTRALALISAALQACERAYADGYADGYEEAEKDLTPSEEADDDIDGLDLTY